nr:uncharacterized protein LOC118877921 [Drosophila suzukii]
MSILHLFSFWIAIDCVITGWVYPIQNCPEFKFAFDANGENPIGLFTAPKTGVSQFNWTVEFSFHGCVNNAISVFEPYLNESMIKNQMENDSPAQMFVGFKEENMYPWLPRMTLLKLNGQTLCSTELNLRCYSLYTLTRNCAVRRISRKIVNYLSDTAKTAQIQIKLLPRDKNNRILKNAVIIDS